jgi:nucleotidyltransferase substrate binding protein (TIGR01987 family)
MEEFKIILDKLKLSTERLEEVLAVEKNEIVRDSAIQRFEMAFELAWKTMRRLLIERGMRAETASPKGIIRQAAQEGLIQDVVKWFEYLEVRNLTIHMYKEVLAEEAYGKLPGFVTLLGELISELEKELV